MSQDDSKSPPGGGAGPTAEFPSVPRAENPQGSGRLLLLFDRESVHRVLIEEGQALVVGRGPEADVTVLDDSVSRRHLRVGLSEGTVWVEDLGSRNGCQLNGQSFRRAQLRTADSVALGGVSLVLHRGSVSADLSRSSMLHDQFMQLLEYEAGRTKHTGHALALLLVRPALGGAEALRQAFPVIQAALEPTALMAFYASNAVEIALVQTDRAKALGVARQIVDVVQASETPVPLCCGVALLPFSATTSEGLVAAASDALQKTSVVKPVVVAQGAGTDPCLRADEDVSTPAGDHGPLVISSAMKELFAMAQKVASTDMPVLIAGETGTGKEVLARAIHQGGQKRRDQPFIAINCGAMPPGLVESTLFGHKKGAFTGADRDAPGVFEAAHRGTLFLDEIGELPALAQAALLRVIEHKRVTRVGATAEREVDVRVVTATHRDLESMSGAGTFRQDLLYRLNTVVLDIPPLRSRRDEIVPLAKRFVAASRQLAQHAVEGLSPEAESALMAYDWPGNVRQLSNAIERAVCLASGQWITVADLPSAVRVRCQDLTNAVRSTSRSLADAIAPMREDLNREFDGYDSDTQVKAPPAADFKTRIQEIETRMILDALRENGWNQTKAAAYLQIPARTMTRKMRAYGIGKLGFDKLDD